MRRARPLSECAAGDNSTVFEIRSGDARWFLKISDRLTRENAGPRWLQGRLPVPQVVAFDQVGGVDALLMTAVPGTNLAALANPGARTPSLKCSPPRSGPSIQ
jgi:aminoglycoside phosphotransferase